MATCPTTTEGDKRLLFGQGRPMAGGAALRGRRQIAGTAARATRQSAHPTPQWRRRHAAVGSGAGSGNSVNNGGGLGMDGGGGTDATIRGCCCMVEGIQCQGFAGPPPPRDNCAEYRYRVDVLGQDPCKEENHRLLCECIAYGCNPGGVRGCIPSPYAQYHHCGCEKFGGLDPWKGTCCNCSPGKIKGGDDGGSGGGPKALMSPGGGCAQCGGGGTPHQSPRQSPSPPPGGGSTPAFGCRQIGKCETLVRKAKEEILKQIKGELSGSGLCCGILSKDELQKLESCLLGAQIIRNSSGSAWTNGLNDIFLCCNFNVDCSDCNTPSHRPGMQGGLNCSFRKPGNDKIYICCHVSCPWGNYPSDICTMIDSLIHECWHKNIQYSGSGSNPDDPAVEKRFRRWIQCWCYNL